MTLCRLCGNKNQLNTSLVTQDSNDVCQYCKNVLEHIMLVKCERCGTVTDIQPDRHNLYKFLCKLGENDLLKDIEWVNPGFVVWTVTCPSCKDTYYGSTQ